jgi:hypothetical protein
LSLGSNPRTASRRGDAFARLTDCGTVAAGAALEVFAQMKTPPSQAGFSRLYARSLIVGEGSACWARRRLREARVAPDSLRRRRTADWCCWAHRSFRFPADRSGFHFGRKSRAHRPCPWSSESGFEPRRFRWRPSERPQPTMLNVFSCHFLCYPRRSTFCSQ